MNFFAVSSVCIVISYIARIKPESSVFIGRDRGLPAPTEIMQLIDCSNSLSLLYIRCASFQIRSIGLFALRSPATYLEGGLPNWTASNIFADESVVHIVSTIVAGLRSGSPGRTKFLKCTSVLLSLAVVQTNLRGINME